ncbi:MAG: STAS domain-containing protein [bacterium]|nr:STAS domain-containing protein [bacterium]
MLDIATDRNIEARILVIHLRGRIDALTAREFDEFFEELLRSGERFFILRGNQLDAVSSAGIGSLVKFVRRLQGLGGGAVFVRLPEEIRLLLEFFGLGELLPVYDSLDDARGALEASLVQFQDSLELKRESTLRTKIRPGKNSARIQQERSDARQDRAHAGSAPDVYARPLSKEGTASDMDPSGETEVRRAQTFAERTHAGRLHQARAASDQSEATSAAHTGPTESELELMGEAGPTESELELIGEAGPTDSEREIMAGARSTSTRTSADAVHGDSVAASENARYEQAVLADQLAREAAAEQDEADREFGELSDRASDEEQAAWSESRVMGCEQCGLNLRIFNFGLHMCPACGIEFDVRRDGNVSFYEKL